MLNEDKLVPTVSAATAAVLRKPRCQQQQPRFYASLGVSAVSDTIYSLPVLALAFTGEFIPHG